MSTHTNARLIRAGHHIITTHLGLPLFEAFSGAVGPLEADANEERLVLVWNAHDQLVAALKSARNAIIATGYGVLDKDAAVARVDAALDAAGVTP